jgi:LDH2 family malate/lactate/ureidoglycolate dehydrogenase
VTRYPSEPLRRFVAGVFEALGMSPEEAEIGATVLHDASLAGVDTHGLVNLPTHAHYALGLRSGEVDPRGEPTVLRDSPVAAAWDSGAGLGLVVAHRAMEAASAKAEAAGVGMVTVRDARHFGANGYFAEMAARRGLIGMVSSNTPAASFPPGGHGRAVGTNPFAFAAPVGDGPPLVFDIAMSAAAGSKVILARLAGEEVPLGWVVDAEGNPTTDPNASFEGGALELLGGEVARHKGYGFALMVDVLGMLSGNGPGFRQPVGAWRQGQWFAAWRIDLFVDPEEFLADMRSLADHVRSVGGQLPGERRAACRVERARDGIPLSDELVAQLRQLGEETGVPFPAPQTSSGSSK